MPLMTAKQRGVRRESNFAGRPGASDNKGTELLPDPVGHVEGAPTQIIASTSFDTDWVCIRLHTTSFSGQNTDYLVNIKVGAASAEQTIIPNLFAGWASVSNTWVQYEFPLRIPAGSRITGTSRAIGTRTAYGPWCLLELFAGGDGLHWVGTGVEAVGADTAASGGTAVTPGITPPWQEFTEVTPGLPPGEIAVVQDGQRNAVKFTRRAEDGAPNRVGVRQVVDRDVQGYDSLLLRFDLKLMYQSVPGGRYLATE